ncbi:MAG: glutamate racemase [Cellvibrionaceae bacterium]|nr:glutamate racemase [Cellvibrionaceae bacterium]
MPTASVLVLDSGIGGLSVTREIRALCPYLHIDYLADLGAFPYGTKSGEEIISRMTTLVDRLGKSLSPSIIVVACNTASTVALDTIRLQTHIPVVGVVPAIKPAAAMSQTGVIGVLATEGTINRRYTHHLIQEFAHSRTVVLHGSSRLVQLAEQKLRNIPLPLDEIRQELMPLLKKAPDMDTVVLACTHFPLLKEEFTEAFPQIKFWVDSGLAIARRVEYLALMQGIKPESEEKPQPNRLYITSPTNQYHQSSLEPLLGDYDAEVIIV